MEVMVLVIVDLWSNQSYYVFFIVGKELVVL